MSDTYTKENFVNDMRSIWVSGGNHLNDQLIENWRLLGEIFENSISKATKPCAFSMGAGEGKSLGASVFTARRGVRSLIVSNLIVNCVDMVKNINEFSEKEIAYLYASEGEDVPMVKAEDVKDAEVLVITHKMLQNVIHGDAKNIVFKDLFFERELTIVDEAIDFSKNYAITYTALTIIVGALHGLNAKMEGTKEYSQWAESEMEPLLVFLNKVKEAKHAEVLKLSSVFGTQLPILKKFVGKRYPDTLNDIIKLEALLASDTFLIKEGSEDTITASTDHIPKELNYVVLDASAKINHTYKEYTRLDIMDVVNTVRARTFANLSIHKIPTRTGRGAITERLKQGELEKFIVSKINPSDKVLIIAHKSVAEELRSLTLNLDTKPMVMYFGAITGRNDAKKCRKIFMFGLPHLPKVVAYQKTARVTGMNSLEQSSIVKAYELSQLVDETYQALMRGAVRVPVDADGNCAPTDIYMTVPSAERGEMSVVKKKLSESLEPLFPNAAIDEVHPSEPEALGAFEIVNKTKMSKYHNQVCDALDVAREMLLVGKFKEPIITIADLVKISGLDRQKISLSLEYTDEINVIHEDTNMLFGEHSYRIKRGNKFIERKRRCFIYKDFHI